MKKIVKKASLRAVSHILLEDGAPINPSDPQPLPLELQNLSLDMKVDNYLMKYEKESLPTQQNYQVPGTDLGAPGGLIPAPAPSPGIQAPAPVGGIAMEHGFRKTFQSLLEADGDDPMADAGGDDPTAGGDDPGANAAPAGGAAPEAPAVENPRFNVRNFAQSVARLILNYEGLLDPKTTILNRARAYVEKNYDAGVAKQMMEILEQQFQLAPRNPEDGTTPTTPVAAGAWTGVGGGGG
jgi:hypothetical protein